MILETEIKQSLCQPTGSTGRLIGFTSMYSRSVTLTNYHPGIPGTGNVLPGLPGTGMCLWHPTGTLVPCTLKGARIIWYR